MRLNIGQKISSIALVILVLMLVVAVYSLQLIAQVTDDLGLMGSKQIPVTEAMARLNVRILEQGVVLQRLYAFGDESLDHTEAAARARRHIERLGVAIDGEFALARDILEREDDLPTRVEQAARELEGRLDRIEEEYRSLATRGTQLLRARERGDREDFERLLPQLNAQQDSVNAAIDLLRHQVSHFSKASVIRAEEDERFLLIANSALTLLAAVLGLGFAILITRALVGSVRSLVDGTERVEAGDLNTEVAVTTTDEVGRLARSFNTMVDGLRLKERIRDTFGKYMDPRIVENLLDNPQFTERGGERREMTVMFVDLEGSTNLAERLSADDLVRTLNAFFTQMTEAVSRHHGVVDKFIGDAVMAYWGPPFTDAGEHAELACRAAVESLGRLDRVRDNVRAALGERAIGIDLRIGISTGEVVVGTIGTVATRNFTVLGDPVNLGSRLEGANKAYGTRVMVSARTRELAGDTLAVRELDMIRVLGREEPARVYELLGIGADVPPQAGVLGGRFREALEAYRGQDWQTAEELFRACLAAVPDDRPSRVFLARIEHLRQEPAAAGWDGVWIFDTK